MDVQRLQGLGRVKRSEDLKVANRRESGKITLICHILP